MLLERNNQRLELISQIKSSFTFRIELSAYTGGFDRLMNLSDLDGDGGLWAKAYLELHLLLQPHVHGVQLFESRSQDILHNQDPVREMKTYGTGDAFTCSAANRFSRRR